MIVALLVCLAATAFTGLMVQADSEHEGPLAPWIGGSSQVSAATAPAPSRSLKAEAGEDGKEQESAYEEVHAFFANLTLGLAVLHLLGVLAGSLIHRENLPRAMITGSKPASPASSAAADGGRPGRA
jgi:cytochrome b